MKLNQERKKENKEQLENVAFVSKLNKNKTEKHRPFVLFSKMSIGMAINCAYNSHNQQPHSTSFYIQFPWNKLHSYRIKYTFLVCIKLNCNFNALYNIFSLRSKLK